MINQRRFVLFACLLTPTFSLHSNSLDILTWSFKARSSQTLYSKFRSYTINASHSLSRQPFRHCSSTNTTIREEYQGYIYFMQPPCLSASYSICAIFSQLTPPFICMVCMKEYVCPTVIHAWSGCPAQYKVEMIFFGLVSSAIADQVAFSQLRLLFFCINDFHSCLIHLQVLFILNEIFIYLCYIQLNSNKCSNIQFKNSWHVLFYTFVLNFASSIQLCLCSIDFS